MQGDNGIHSVSEQCDILQPGLSEHSHVLLGHMAVWLGCQCAGSIHHLVLCVCVCVCVCACVCVVVTKGICQDGAATPTCGLRVRMYFVATLTIRIPGTSSDSEQASMATLGRGRGGVEGVGELWKRWEEKTRGEGIEAEGSSKVHGEEE